MKRKIRASLLDSPPRSGGGLSLAGRRLARVDPSQLPARSRRYATRPQHRQRAAAPPPRTMWDALPWVGEEVGGVERIRGSGGSG